MKTEFTHDSASIATPLASNGFIAIGDDYCEEHFGNGWLLLTKGDVLVRIVRERLQWFIEVGSSAAPEEWFDARLVLSEVACTSFPDGATDLAAARQIAQELARCASRWEVLFLNSMFATARKGLRARQIAFAKEHFGVTIKE